MGNAQIGPIKDVEKTNSKKPSTTITIEAMDHCWEINFNIVDQSPTLVSLFQDVPKTGKSVEVIYEEITEDLDPMDVERALRFINLHPKDIKEDLNIIGIPDLIRGLFLANYLQSVCFAFIYGNRNLVVYFYIKPFQTNLIEGHQLRILQVLMGDNFFMFYKKSEELGMDDFKLELYKIFRTEFEMWKENDAFLKAVPRHFMKALIQDGQTLTSTGEIGMYRTIKKVICVYIFA